MAGSNFYNYVKERKQSKTSISSQTLAALRELQDVFSLDEAIEMCERSHAREEGQDLAWMPRILSAL